MATTDESIKKNISQNIVKHRERAGLSQKELANKLGVTSSRVSNWEQGANCPTIDILFKVCEILNVSINDMYGVYPETVEKLTFEEIEHIKKYRLIDSYGQETVNIVLDRELNRAKQLDTSSSIPASPILRIYTYMRRIACAGTGFYFDDIPTATMEAPYMEGADFIIGVNGDSMEPEYHDGDNLYVKKTSDLAIGDIGIFTIRNECYLKKLGEDGLVSLNPKYRNIPGSEDMRLVGKVIGKVK